MNDIHISTKSDIKKTKAIELWRETHGHISNICRALGLHRNTFYNWMKDDPEFSMSLLEAEGELNDDIRDALIQKAADGDMAAIIFYLRKRHPDFLDKPTSLTQINVKDNQVEFILDEN